MRSAQTPGSASDPPGGASWYRYPVAWLGMLILAASLAGIAALIVVAERYPDASLELRSERILRAPVAQPPSDPQTSHSAGEASSTRP